MFGFVISASLRPAVTADEPFLWAMLYEASHAADQGLTVADLATIPALARYVAKWGLDGDLGVIGGPAESPSGAAWLRLLTGADAGYGYVDDTTPELAIAVAPRARGTGLGTAMLERLVADAAGRYPAVSLSVREENPARRLYQRMGFADVDGSRIVNRAGTTSVTMVLRLR
ncbi:GNAT family N-acetyltransferase [Nocardia amikacinitolerans]|uniref:GNAT family N-acetyltransferase n=1 Tax=Nocardia amikacinitolerans TaxID=756689 RepID=UPI0020A542AD|nr:GNAT family N-acetyltransferase [Nocardia amikacinitolerans]MCP2292579.1 Ribosomal protein S18 acetylase RimI [Nocardia amikacinitolerans]